MRRTCFRAHTPFLYGRRFFPHLTDDMALAAPNRHGGCL
nr:MAG TPA: hypothetical protein [Caudoviricetes sp.]